MEWNTKIIQNQTKMEKNQMNKQVGGIHYEILKIQPVELFDKYDLNWFQGEVIKYVSRYRNKNGLQDLMKAHHILSMDRLRTYSDIIKTFDYDRYKYMSYSYMYLEYIDQFKEGYFIDNTLSWSIFKDMVIAILNKDYRLAKHEVEMLIYVEYGEKVN